MGELRKNFGRIKRYWIFEPDRYPERFLPEISSGGNRSGQEGNYGLQALPQRLPISDFSGKCSLEFVSYKIGAIRYDMQECVQKGMTMPRR